MNLTSVLQLDASPVILNALVQQWLSMSYLLQEQPTYGKFEEYMAQVLNPILSVVGWNATGSVDTYDILSTCCLPMKIFIDTGSSFICWGILRGSFSDYNG